ncbi:MAG: HAMP domain-containing histidine kinase [Methylobacteriaceae bacterium]|nr:HAMP domain-containing histidine kinase [Methylobacteriaceae bacterium]
MSEVTAEMIARGRGADPDSAAQRRRLAFRVREVREKLTSSGTGQRAFDVELLHLFALARRSVAVPTLGLVVVVGLMSSLWIPPVDLLLWIGVVCATLLVGYSLAGRFLAATNAQINVVAWRGRFLLSETMQGVAFALIASLIVHYGDADARAFALIVLLLVAAINATVSAAIPGAAYCTLTPVTLAIVLALRGFENATTLPIATLAIAAQVYFVILARRLYGQSLATLTFQAEKNGLIAELEQAKANSDEARRRAEEANLAKSRFLATMSHELRTPLNAILGFSEVMQGELFGPHSVSAYKEYSNDIHSSGQHLLMLINEILDLSRVEAGRYELKEESVSLNAIVEDCCRLLTLRAQKRDIKISEAVESDLPRIWADERAIRQVVLNLLSNAIKFTPQGGQVTIKLGWTAAGGQYLSIRDTGPGIPENEIPVVMSSFGRGTLAQKNADEGTGLGLPIVKGLIELHGGMFSLRSKVREGTEVIVVLPPERIMNALPKLDPVPPQPAFQIVSDQAVA